MRGKSIHPHAPRMLAAGFNEARALCAGSHTTRASFRKKMVGFNEARALCAGSRKTNDQATRPEHCFNEARALCAGSPNKECQTPKRDSKLQ